MTTKEKITPQTKNDLAAAFDAELQATKKDLAEDRKQRLAEIGVLAILETRSWSARIKATKEAKKLAKELRANEEMLSASKRLLAHEKLKAISQPVTEAKALHRKLTTPWRGEKIGLCPNNLVFRYRNEMAAIIARHDRAVEEFVPVYPALRDEAIRNNGDLLTLEEFPDVEDIADRFLINVDWELLPAITNAIQSSLADQDLEFVVKHATAQRDAQIQESIKSNFERLADVTKKMLDRLTLFKVVEDDIGATSIENDFKRSLITNITDQLDLMPSLNIFNDRHLTAIATEIRQRLTAYDFETLKSSEYCRNKTLEAANELYEKMQKFL